MVNSLLGRPGESMDSVNFLKIQKDLHTKFKNLYITKEDVMSYAMYPKVTEDFLKFKMEYGKVSVLDTKTFLVGPKVGQELSIELSPGKLIYIKVLFSNEI